MEPTMIKYITLIALLSLSFASFATPKPDINVESLLMQKQYLKNINQCATEKSFNTFIKSAIKDANTFYLHGNYAETIEETVINNPACFVYSASKLSQKDCQVLNEAYIKEPFFYPRAMLTDSLNKVKGINQTCLAG